VRPRGTLDETITANVLVDLNDLTELTDTEVGDGEVVFDGLVRHWDVELSTTVRQTCPFFTAAQRRRRSVR
jgi:CO/xanthine dehydrogenase FAD-binding subunit